MSREVSKTKAQAVGEEVEHSVRLLAQSQVLLVLAALVIFILLASVFA